MKLRRLQSSEGLFWLCFNGTPLYFFLCFLLSKFWSDSEQPFQQYHLLYDRVTEGLGWPLDFW